MTLRQTKRELTSHAKIYKYTTLNPYERRYTMYLAGEANDPPGHHVRITRRVSIIDLPATRTQYKPRCTCGWSADHWLSRELDAIKEWQVVHLYDFCKRNPPLPLEYSND